MLNRALKYASHNQDKGRFTLCAIITDKKGSILSIGYNSYSRTHTTQAYYAEKTGNIHRIFIHAEIDALTKVPYGKKPYAIYIARANGNGEAVLAKPCVICQEAIKDSGIKKIYYTGEEK